LANRPRQELPNLRPEKAKHLVVELLVKRDATEPAGVDRI